ncbi:beta-lactamase family protein [Sphingosinicellaceae bacterium]|nr:beta-lactamase family protein [Sphingosinicellaceae bacterium]
MRSSLFAFALWLGVPLAAQTTGQTTGQTALVDAFFTDPKLAETRAVIVLQDGKIVAERYGKGYGPANRLIGWSMSKSITATLIGQLIGEGRLVLDAPAPVAAWHRDPADPRGKITLRQLLHMSSGVRHDELGNPDVQDADTNRALFADVSADAATFAETRPLQSPPGTAYNYSSLTTVVLADIAVRAIAPDARTPVARREAMRAYLKSHLVDPVMPSLICEFDAAGTMIGGSFCHATPRDWARFGQLYLDGGKVGDLQLVPPAWVVFVRTPAPTNPSYGGHFWLNRANPKADDAALFPDQGPADTFSPVGHLGQFVTITPSKRLVVLRMGKTQDPQLAPVKVALGRLVNSYPDAP